MSNEEIEHFCRGKIDPSIIGEMKGKMMFDPHSFIEGKELIPTQIGTFRSSLFIAFMELAETICSGLDWNKKGRIVVEYDPQQRNFHVATFQEAQDIGIGSDHEETPRFLLRQADR